MIDQVNSNDWDAGFFDEISSVRKDENVAEEKGERAFSMVDGIRKPIITTKGWSIQMEGWVSIMASPINSQIL